MKANVIVADAEAVARFGLVKLIDSHKQLRVCAEAESLSAARELCAKHQPEVVVLDPAMGDGFAFIKDVPRWSPRTRVVAMTGLEDALSVQRAFKAGACGYVTRRDPVAAVIAAILGAVAGERHVGPRVEHVLLERLASGGVEIRDSDEAALSDRELQVFRLLGRGLGTRAVAEELRVSVKTVETHRQRIRGKLHLATGTELQRRAVLYHGANGEDRTRPPVQSA
ncbi:MAG: response regulator transcription factor [Chthoniobacteraceae bacterium]